MDLGSWELLITVAISAGTGLGAGLLKDAITKNNIKNKIEILEDNKKEVKIVTDELKEHVQSFQSEIIRIQKDIQSINSNISKFEITQRQEIGEINNTLKENTRAIIQLEATLKSISRMITKNNRDED